MHGKTEHLVFQPAHIELIWRLIDHLPANMYDFSRDAHGFGNLLMTLDGVGVGLHQGSGGVSVTHQSG